MGALGSHDKREDGGWARNWRSKYQERRNSEWVFVFLRIAARANLGPMRDGGEMPNHRRNIKVPELLEILAVGQKKMFWEHNEFDFHLQTIL